ncbi:MAG: RdgB/HAM1 family non-canonical purine NTP pyrophosphatase [Paludibacteraceae bacterium]|nr:RdgB/HAM1 family non-canonical purine NTP pyrophosphatase [Paludibacteraceae bacterium]
MKLIFASNNTHKLDEVRQILSPIEVLGLRQIEYFNEIEETGDTLEANSLIKAQTIWDWLCKKGLTTTISGVLADDTGLEINALNNAPGVYSARWAGIPSNDNLNRQKALAELAGIQDRSARFRTVITWISQTGIQQVDGIINGQMATEESGEGGFGYDALFIPQGYDVTFAMLSAEEKNSISHRARALHQLRTLLEL